MNMDRRKFLSQSLAASAGLAGLPSLAVGRPSKEKYRVGIIGCGRMGQYFAEVYRALPDTELVAIAEWNPERRKIVGERFGVKALYKDVNAMLKEVVPRPGGGHHAQQVYEGSRYRLCRSRGQRCFHRQTRGRQAG